MRIIAVTCVTGNSKGEVMKIILCAAEMAVIAKKLLDENGGFTIDEYGCTPPSSAPWVVSKVGHEKWYRHEITLGEIERYILRHPILDGAMSDAYFGGWSDENGITYLDHTLLFAHKHTAIHEAVRNGQKAIFNLETKETVNVSQGETV